MTDKDARIAELEAELLKCRSDLNIERGRVQGLLEGSEAARLREALDPEAERGVSAGGDYEEPGGSIVCPHCHAHIAYEGERPTDCLGCSAALAGVYPRGLDGSDGLEDGHWAIEQWRSA